MGRQEPGWFDGVVGIDGKPMLQGQMAGAREKACQGVWGKAEDGA